MFVNFGLNPATKFFKIFLKKCVRFYTRHTIVLKVTQSHM